MHGQQNIKIFYILSVNW